MKGYDKVKLNFFQWLAFWLHDQNLTSKTTWSPHVWFLNMDKCYCITRTKVKGCESKPSHFVLFWFFIGTYPGLHSHSKPGIKLVQVVEFKSHCAVPSVHSSISTNRDEILGVNCFSVSCGFSSFSAFFLKRPLSEVKATPFLLLCLRKIPRVRVNKIIELWYVIVLADDYYKQCGYFYSIPL